jgi:L-ascorbate metabolism protein UlaG (beta-lactamase superfamily)
MKISKHVHSCLLVEEQNKTILIDPGNYTAQDKALDLPTLGKLDFLLITHEHADHMDIPLIKEIVRKFPDIEIKSNSSVAEILAQEGLRVSTQGNEFIEIENAPHEKLLGGSAPVNVLFRIFGKLTHPGDSLCFDGATEVLALPIQAPWGSTVATVEKAALLKQQIVIPIHDWHWKDEARKRLYSMATAYLQNHGVELHGLETGAALEV